MKMKDIVDFTNCEQTSLVNVNKSAENCPSWSSHLFQVHFVLDGWTDIPHYYIYWILTTQECCKKNKSYGTFKNNYLR